MAAALQYVVLTEGTGSIDIEPLIHAVAVKMVTTRKFSKLDPIIISRKADATLLQMIISIQTLLIRKQAFVKPQKHYIGIYIRTWLKAKFIMKQA